MYSITDLPTEVIEYILLHLTSEDIHAWMEATALELSDSFWKKTCLRDGVVSNEEGRITDSAKWKGKYLAYLNWKTGNYSRRYFPCSGKPVKLHKANLFFSSEDSLSVCNIAENPKFVQTLPAKTFHTFGPFLVLTKGGVLRIYKYTGEMFSHFRTIVVNNKAVQTFGTNKDDTSADSKLETSVAINENYFVIYQHKFNLLTIINLSDESLKHIDTDCNFLFGLSICCQSVFAFWLKCNKYILNKFSLTSNLWEKPVEISQNAAAIMVPKLRYTEKIVVSLITCFFSSSNDLKIIDTTNGNVLHLVQIDSSFTWFCLDNNYVIYPTATSVIGVWNYDIPETIAEIKVEPGFRSGSTGPGCVLIIVYEYWLDVYDYRNCYKLYKINFDEPNMTPLMNEWYCVLVGSEYQCLYIFDFKKGRQKGQTDCGTRKEISL